MVKKKKAPANGFYYFMVDYKQKQGRNVKSMQEAAIEAGPHWARMTPEQKRPYEERAKHEKAGIKYTSYNENIDVIQREAKNKVERETKMKIDIENIISSNINLGQLSDTWFYLIHVNEFCYCLADKRNYPAEIAVLRFNLNYGVLVENIYHKIVNPGKLPLGYAATAKAKSEDTHQLPIPFNDESNLEEVIYDLQQFISAEVSTANPGYPPLFACESDFELVDNVLDHMCDDFGYPRSNFKLYETQWLLFNLRNREAQVWPSVSNAVLELEKDPYCYTTSIGCEMHEVSEVDYHCSRSHVVRTAFTICDCVCPEMGLELIAGQHVPTSSSAALKQLMHDQREVGAAAGSKGQGWARSVASSLVGDYMCDAEDDEDAGNATCRASTAYSLATSVCGEFVDTEDSVSQVCETEWNTVGERTRKRTRPLAVQSASGSEMGATSQLSTPATLGQPTQSQSQPKSAASQQSRRPNTVSMAAQFRNLTLPSSGVGTAGSSVGVGSIGRGRGRGLLNLID